MTNQAAPEIRELAQLVLALEAGRSERAEENTDRALSVFDKLRSRLSKLVGIAGFQALLSRALALSKTEVPWLEVVFVHADATLYGLSEAGRQQPADAVARASATLLAHVLELLVIFIGRDLTLRLVMDVWPQAEVDLRNLRAKETPE